MAHRSALVSKITLAVVSAFAVLLTGVPERVMAQPVEPAEEILHFHMGLGVDPGVLEDQSSRSNNGILYNFPEPLAAYGEENSGIDTFVSFDGSQHVATEDIGLPPSQFEIEIEFRTLAPLGKMFGFEDSQVGLGTLSDRLLYVASDGRLHFGGASGISITVPSLDPVTDGEWHVATARATTENSLAVYELYIDGVMQGRATGRTVSSYPGYWRLGSGNIMGYPNAGPNGFIGDIRHVLVFEQGNSPIEPMPEPEPDPDPIVEPEPQPDPPIVPLPTEIPIFEPDFEFNEEFFHEHPFIRRGPWVDVTSDIDGDDLTLDISIGNVDLFDKTVWVVREEDGEEFIVGAAASAMTWEGEARTSRYSVEVRAEDPFSELEEPNVVASGSVPVFHQPASAAQVATAVAVTVAVAGAASAASASGTWIYELIWRFLRIVLAERLRRRTKNFDVSSIPSWAAATIAILLMALLIAVGRPGALGLNNFLVALTVSVPAVILFRLVTILGGYGLAYYTNQKPRYLVWVAGTVSFAITSIILQSPIGYTGYMDRDPSTKERDARFAAAGFSAVLALSGLFVMIGLLTRMSFAETGVTLTLGVLAVTMLPFPLMGGYAVWKWNRIAGGASGVVGMTPYILFQLGLLSPTGIVTLATLGILAFAWFLVGELWLSERARMLEANAASAATAEGASAV